MLGERERRHRRPRRNVEGDARRTTTDTEKRERERERANQGTPKVEETQSRTYAKGEIERESKAMPKDQGWEKNTKGRPMPNVLEDRGREERAQWT